MKTGGKKRTLSSLEARVARFAAAMHKIRKVQARQFESLTPLLESGVILGGPPPADPPGS